MEHGQILRATALALVVAGGLLTTPAMAADYAGKTITLTVGTGTGGGFDRYGRAVARHIVKHIPGKPTVIVRNMPGAGSMKAVEFIYSLAPKDGTQVAIVFPGALVEPLVNDKQEFRFEPPKLEYIGSANSGTRLCVTFHTSKIKTFEDAQKMESSMGGNSPGSSTTDYAEMMNNLAGAKMKIVNGYKSTSDIVLAMERGELDGMCGFDATSFQSQRPDWYGTKLTHMILQAGITPDAQLEKLGAPSVWKFVTGKNREAAELILAQQEFHRPFIAPPGTSKEFIATLRTAFDATMKDAEFLDEAKKSNLDVAPKTGAEVDALIKKMYGSPKDVVELARKALGR